MVIDIDYSSFTICHCKQFTQHALIGWLVVFGLNDPLRQYFSLYRVVSKREGERKDKG